MQDQYADPKCSTKCMTISVIANKCSCCLRNRSHQNKIEQVDKGLIGLNSEKENIDENLILQDKLWKIAIKKSYFTPDINDEDTSNESVQK